MKLCGFLRSMHPLVISIIIIALITVFNLQLCFSRSIRRSRHDNGHSRLYRSVQGVQKLYPTFQILPTLCMKERTQ